MESVLKLILQEVVSVLVLVPVWVELALALASVLLVSLVLVLFEQFSQELVSVYAWKV